MTAPSRPDVLAVLAPHCLDGRTALVTGGGSGIGRATALLLASLGARVAVTGRREDALAETASLAEAAGAAEPVVVVACDVREPEQVDAMLDAVLAEVGVVDVLLNNAGGQFVAPAETVSHKGFRAVTRPLKAEARVAPSRGAVGSFRGAGSWAPRRRAVQRARAGRRMFMVSPGKPAPPGAR